MKRLISIRSVIIFKNDPTKAYLYYRRYRGSYSWLKTYGYIRRMSNRLGADDLVDLEYRKKYVIIPERYLVTSCFDGKWYLRSVYNLSPLLKRRIHPEYIKIMKRITKA